jgi:AAA domain
MLGSDVDLLSIDRGLVVAPAGCGKTQLIADTLVRHTAQKPILILTHTNAGVAALRERLNRARVSSSQYRLMTLDGWALRLSTMFPARAGYSSNMPALLNYPNIRAATVRLLKAGHIGDALNATYERLFVDEYQDCSFRQHAIVYYAAHWLPTCVLGDPLQSIFGFDVKDPLAEWEKHVCGFFPAVAELDVPWRWINAGTEVIGQWLLRIREQLLTGEPINLQEAPAGIQWISLDGGPNDHVKLLDAALVNRKGRQRPCIGDRRQP